MRKLTLLQLALALCLPALYGQAAREPRLVLLTLTTGQSAQAGEGKGNWVSLHPDIATVSADGLVTALKDGYTLVLLTNNKKETLIRCEVKVGDTPVPEAIERVIALALADWEQAGGKALPKYNLYTQWYNPAAKNGFGWCGAFVGLQFEEAGVEMNKEYRAKNAPPLPDGSLFAVRQASQTKLFEGFQSRNRLSAIPRPGYYIIYGRRGSTPYTHIGLITAVEDLGNGVYRLETVEGNLGSRIKRFNYLYDSLAERRERNIASLPESQWDRPDLFNYVYVKDFYINSFGQTWY